MTTRYTWRTLILEIVMIAAALVIAVPLYVLINLAIRPASDLSSPLVPTSAPSFDNFATAWTTGNLAPALLISVLVTVVSTVLIVALSAAAAYPLARVTRRWSRAVFLIFMFGLIVPIQLGTLPLYQTFRDIGLLGTPWALVIFYAGSSTPFTIFLFVGFIRSLPVDFEQAALIDGCTPLQAFWHVVLPALKPITSTAIVLNAVAVWNDFFTPLLYLSGTDSQTLPVAVSSFASQYFNSWNVLFAGIVIAIVPVLVFYLLLQRYIINGFAGGLKG